MPRCATIRPVAEQDALIAHTAVLGTVRQAMLDLGIVATRLADVQAGLVTAGERGYSQLATQLDSLSAELAQAAGWLRGATGDLRRGH